MCDVFDLSVCLAAFAGMDSHFTTSQQNKLQNTLRTTLHDIRLRYVAANWMNEFFENINEIGEYKTKIRITFALLD